MNKRETPVPSHEQGSALLIVLLFAAIIAIGLYSELPIAAFEAQRQKEELLISRGNEYKHAVKLFVRRLRTYPSSIEALENSNMMRFLRHRYADPFTKQQDWRLIHAGPGGIPLDSKIKPDSFEASGNPNQPDSPSGAQLPALTPLLMPGVAAQITDNSPATVDSQEQRSAPNDLENGSGVGQDLHFGGAILGVASNARGRSIRLVNKQNEYSLWEFYYNPAVDGGSDLDFQRAPSEGVNGSGAPGTNVGAGSGRAGLRN